MNSGADVIDFYEFGKRNASGNYACYDIKDKQEKIESTMSKSNVSEVEMEKFRGEVNTVNAKLVGCMDALIAKVDGAMERNRADYANHKVWVIGIGFGILMLLVKDLLPG